MPLAQGQPRFAFSDALVILSAHDQLYVSRSTDPCSKFYCSGSFAFIKWWWLTCQQSISYFGNLTAAGDCFLFLSDFEIYKAMSNPVTQRLALYCMWAPPVTGVGSAQTERFAFLVFWKSRTHTISLHQKYQTPKPKYQMHLHTSTIPYKLFQMMRSSTPEK